MKFTVGDRVRVKAQCDFSNMRGMTGTVVSVKLIKSGLSYGVYFDKRILGGHSCDGICEDGHGYYFYGDNWIEPIKPVEEEQKPVRVIITYTPEETSVKRVCGKAVTNEAGVRKYSGDKDDEYTAVRCALDKLYGKKDEATLKPAEPEKIKGYTGVAVYSGDWTLPFTRGKSYVFKDGYTVDDAGEKRPYYDECKSEPLDKWFNRRFIKLVE